MDREFSPSDPNARMAIVSKIERIQPTVVGIDERGEFIWEGRAMPRWQMEMFTVAVNWWGEFFSHWCELSKAHEKDFNQDGGDLPPLKACTKARLAEMRRMYPRRHKEAR